MIHRLRLHLRLLFRGGGDLFFFFFPFVSGGKGTGWVDGSGEEHSTHITASIAAVARREGKDAMGTFVQI